MRVALALVGLAVIGAGTFGYVTFFRGRDVQGGEARALVASGARLLDVRSPEEFGRGHLPGAVNIPVRELAGRVGEVGATVQEVVVYCRSGHRSAQAAAVLRQHGFTKVHDLGAMTAW
jgi:phage shock protein E